MFIDKLTVQRQYADLVGPRLERHTVQSYSPYKANFRCPICGDSARNKFKKRAYFLERDQLIQFYCHNSCGGMAFEKFLKKYHEDLYSEYRLEIIKQYKKEKSSDTNYSIEKESYDVSGIFGKLSGIGDSPLHVQKYLYNRKIVFHDIWYTPNFYSFINEFIPDKFNLNSLTEHERIILPLRNYGGEVFGVIGRSLESKHEPKYITIKFSDDNPKIFGMDRVDKEHYGYCFEGPIDSLFLDNSIALLGTDGDPLHVFPNKSRFTIILDNQPRNEQVISKYKKYIHNGYNIVIWPESIKGKDINDMIIDGKSRVDVKNLIDNNTYSELKAEVKFRKWKKI